MHANPRTVGFKPMSSILGMVDGPMDCRARVRPLPKVLPSVEARYPGLRLYLREEQTDALLARLRSNPQDIEFQEVMNIIAETYEYTPVLFNNGSGQDRIINQAGENEGSCKIFAFAQLQGLTKDETLACFGQYYRQDVLQHPQGTDHLNIRTFMRHGWDGIHFDGLPLSLTN